MRRNLLLALQFGFLIGWLFCAESWALPQTRSNTNTIPAPPGAFFAWYKLLMIIGPFLLWVKTSDWLNRDAIRLGERTGMPPQLWNPIVVGSFLVGFLLVLFIPLFTVGYPLFVTATLIPFASYFLIRRSKLKADPALKQISNPKGKSSIPPPPPLPQDEGAKLEFTPAGEDQAAKQSNLIQARQAAEFPAAKNLLNDMLLKRAEVLVLDYSRGGVASKFQVDGVWHPLPPMERPVGDLMLVSLKCLAGLNPADRRTKQTGKFQIKGETEKLAAELATQGVSTGERAQIMFLRQRKTDFTLPQLGMFPEAIALLRDSLNAPAITIATSGAAEGLTSTWKAALLNTGQLTRDCVALVPPNNQDSVVENIAQKEYAKPQDQLELLRGVLLMQPDFLAVPHVANSEMMDALVQQVAQQKRSIFLQGVAPSAAAGLLALRAQAGNKQQFGQHLKLAIGQRLLRRLCPDCRREMRVAPDLIKKLGGDPKRQQTIYDHYRLPPPEQRVDENGKPIEFPPCGTCGGIGYLGRIAVFETLEVDDRMRELLRQNPSAEQVEAAAQKSGKNPLQKNAQTLVLLGVTSIAEIQRVFKK